MYLPTYPTGRGCLCRSNVQRPHQVSRIYPRANNRTGILPAFPCHYVVRTTGTAKLRTAPRPNWVCQLLYLFFFSSLFFFPSFFFPRPCLCYPYFVGDVNVNRPLRSPLRGSRSRKNPIASHKRGLPIVWLLWYVFPSSGWTRQPTQTKLTRKFRKSLLVAPMTPSSHSPT